ncbi:hypothetical protein GCM10009592_11670 [Brachybacterium rhamnosum]
MRAMVSPGIDGGAARVLQAAMGSSLVLGARAPHRFGPGGPTGPRHAGPAGIGMLVRTAVKEWT